LSFHLCPGLPSGLIIIIITTTTTTIIIIIIIIIGKSKAFLVLNYCDKKMYHRAMKTYGGVEV